MRALIVGAPPFSEHALWPVRAHDAATNTPPHEGSWRVVWHERHDLDRLRGPEKPRWAWKSRRPGQPGIRSQRRHSDNRAFGQVAFDGRLAIDVCLAKSCREPVYKRAEVRFGVVAAEPLCTCLFRRERLHSGRDQQAIFNPEPRIDEVETVGQEPCQVSGVAVWLCRLHLNGLGGPVDASEHEVEPANAERLCGEVTAEIATEPRDDAGKSFAAA